MLQQQLQHNGPSKQHKSPWICGPSHSGKSYPSDPLLTGVFRTGELLPSPAPGSSYATSSWPKIETTVRAGIWDESNLQETGISKYELRNLLAGRNVLVPMPKSSAACDVNCEFQNLSIFCGNGEPWNMMTNEDLKHLPLHVSPRLHRFAVLLSTATNFQKSLK